LLFVLLGWTSRPSPGASLSEIIKQVKPSIVGIGSHEPLRRPANVLAGTGFLVGDGSHVITCDHVVKPFAALTGKEYLAVFIGAGEPAQTRRARLVASDPAHDTALLEVEGEPGRPLQLEVGESAEEGQSVAFTGFPIGAVYGLRPVTHRGIISAVTPIVIPQISARLLDNTMIRRLKSDFNVYQLDATAYPGNSGSPVYDPETGRVLALLSSVFVKQTKEKLLADPSGITFAIPIRYARELMARARLGDSEGESPDR
jgi:S1-C subfamily serine protease